MAEKLRTPETKHPSRLRKIARGLTALFMTASSALFLPGSERPERIVSLTHPDAVPVTGDGLTFMSANVHGWKDPNGGNNLGKLTAALDKHDVDVACLQEVFVRHGELQKLHEAGYNVAFAESKYYVFMGQFGNAVISRSPIHVRRVIDLPPGSAGEPRNVMFVELETDQGRWEFMNTHMSYRRNEKPEQNNVLLAAAARNDVSLACGDFNQTAHELDAAGYDEIFDFSPQTTQLETFPTTRKSRRRGIDFVLDRCGMSYDEQSIQITPIGSDHFGVVRHVELANCE